MMMKTYQSIFQVIVFMKMMILMNLKVFNLKTKVQAVQKKSQVFKIKLKMKIKHRKMKFRMNHQEIDIKNLNGRKQILKPHYQNMIQLLYM